MVVPSLRGLSYVSLAVAASLAFGSHQASATDGMLPHGFGAASKAMAGVGVAMPEDTQTAVANPAGMVHVGNRVDLGIGFFSPNRDVTATGGTGNSSIPNTQFNSKNRLFLVPEAGVNYMISPDTSIGLTLTGSGGMNTEYLNNPFNNFCAAFGASCSKPAGVDLMQAGIGLTIAHKVGIHSFGVTPILAVQKFKAYGLTPFTLTSNDSNHVTDQGYDHSVGYGIRLGYMADLGSVVTPGLSFGASYQSQLDMTKFSKYRGLFAEQGDLDVPAVVKAGIAYKVPSTELTLGFDWNYIMYRDVEAIGNDGVMSLNSLFGGNSIYALGGDEGAGFGWNNMHVYKLGAKWEAIDGLTLRAGVSHNSGAYTNHDMLFNIVAPATIRTHASVGATYDFDGSSSLTLAYTRAFSDSVSGTHVSATNTDITHRMDQHDAVVTYSYRW